MSKKKMLSFAQFIKRFPNEKACVEYLYNVKWPKGFECPICGCRHGYALKNRRQYQCANCRHQTSLTANTVMHRSHLSLTKWFWAIYLVACAKRGISALLLAGKIEVCYETAWNLLRRIRAAMEMRDEHYVLQGIVEFDDSYFGAGKKGNIPGQGGRARGNQAVFVAVSKDEKGNPAHLRMQLTPYVRSVSIEAFARSRIAYASTVQTDGFNAYRKPLAKRYNHEWEVFNPNGELLKWLHHMIGNAKTFINGTYHGTSTTHLQMYLSEFCYRFNRRKLGAAIFDRLLVAIAG